MFSLPSILVAAGALLATVDAAGCGTTQKVGFQDNIGFTTSANVSRTYGIYVPTNYNTNSSAPKQLIFDFHGHGGSSSGQYNNSRYYANGSGKNFVVVYPNGLPAGSNNERAWQGAPYAASGVDDLGFVRDLLKYVSGAYCIDSQHVYASGKSNGGGFTDTLACSDVGDSFSAFAMASAALYTDDSYGACSKKRAIMESHGDLDTTIYPTGGCYADKSPCPSGSQYPDILQWTQWFAQRDGCASTTQPALTQGNGYNYTAYSCGGFGSVVSHYKVFKLGHCWPTTTVNTDTMNIANCNDTVLDYTQKVVDFFGKWSLSTAPKN